MTQARPREVFDRLAGDALDRLLGHVTWHATGSRSLSSKPGDHYPLVIVLGREHYSERRESYPALRRRDLEKVLRQELVNEPPTLTLIGPRDGDRREVRFYRLNSAVIESLPRSLFIVPESVLLGARLAAESWADVERQNYRYFLFNDAPSQPAGGALNARDLVAMAAGVDTERAPEEWRGSEEILGRLRDALRALPATTWWSCRNPLSHDFGISRVAWKPIGLTVGLMLFGYLALSSAYLQASLSHREGAIEALGPEVQEGIVADNEARAYAVQRDALIELWSGRLDTQQLWQGIALALQDRATISYIDTQDERISVRGEAPDATAILAALATMSGFVDVSFDAPVRSGKNGRQNFALSFALSNAPAASQNPPEMASESTDE